MTNQELEVRLKEIEDSIARNEAETNGLRDQLLSTNQQMADLVTIIGENKEGISENVTELNRLTSDLETFKTQTDNRLAEIESNLTNVMSALNEEVMPEIKKLQEIPESLAPAGGSENEFDSGDGLEFAEPEPDDVIRMNIEMSEGIF